MQEKKASKSSVRSGAGIDVAWINRKNEMDEMQLATYSISRMKEGCAL